ncbi:MAG: STAS domain-containing protein [Nitrospirae bacterium]|nr:STAS domain-containing protein [Nitrospirota bacterium]
MVILIRYFIYPCQVYFSNYILNKDRNTFYKVFIDQDRIRLSFLNVMLENCIPLKMNCDVKKNLIIIKQDALDIYDATALKEKITSVSSTVTKSLVIDLGHLEDISTPAIQILISAKKSIEDLKFININESIVKNLILLGSSL